MKTNCTLYRQKITAYLNQELNKTETVAFNTHVEQCETCRKKVESQREALALLDQALKAAPTPRASTVEEIFAKKAPPPRAIWKNPQLQAAAATLVILLSLGFWLATQKIERHTAHRPTQTPTTIRYGNEGFVLSLRPTQKENQPNRYATFCKISPTGQQIKVELHDLLNRTPTKQPSIDHAGEYQALVENGFKPVCGHPLSTFAMNVDTASYSTIRHCLSENRRPDPRTIRIEELVNSFNYDYPKPKKNALFSIALEASNCPWNPAHQLVLIGIKSKDVNFSKAPPNNLLFVIDCSKSMKNNPDRLPLLKRALRRMLKDMRPTDQLGIVTFSSPTPLVLEPTANKQKIIQAIDSLQEGSSPNHTPPLNLAYTLLKKTRIQNGNNRIILATDKAPTTPFLTTIKMHRKEHIPLSVLDFSTTKNTISKLERFAHQAKGKHIRISHLLDARKALVSEMGGQFFTVAEKATIQVEFNPLYVKEYRLIGYENQHILTDGSLDAGTIGAGHTVTALYELIPANLPYLSNIKSSFGDLVTFDELMSVNLQYKRPKSNKTHHLVQSIKVRNINPTTPSNNIRFTRAVAEFGLLMKNSKYKAAANFEHVLTDAKKARGKDLNGWRNDFIQLVKKAQAVEK